MNYYVYEHSFSNGTNYIGKGKGNRAYRFSNGRNTHYLRLLKKYGEPKVVILVDNISEQDALANEVALISFYRRHNCPLCNITNGGEGVSGHKMSIEQKEANSIRVSEYYSNPSNKEYAAIKTKEAMQRPEVKEKLRNGVQLAYTTTDLADRLSKIHKDRYKDNPELAKVQSSRMYGSISTDETREKTSKSLKEYYSVQENRDKLSNSQKEAWGNEVIREVRIAGIRKYYSDPQAAKRLSELRKGKSNTKEHNDAIKEAHRNKSKKYMLHNDIFGVVELAIYELIEGYGLSRTSVYRLLTGKISSHKGWTLINIQTTGV